MSKLSKIKLCVINLEKDIKRRNNISSNVINNIKDIDCIFYKAVDAKDKLKIVNTNCKDLDLIIYDNNSVFLSDYNYRIDYDKRGKIKIGTIGCNLSHIFLCDELIFDDKYDYYLVLEDDSSLNVDVNILYEYLNNLPDKFDFIHLDKSDAFEFIPTDKVNSYYYNVEKKYFNRTSAYLISKFGAAKYVSYFKHNICRPPDDSFSNLFIFKNFNTLIPREWLFKLSEDSNTSSIGEYDNN